MLETLVNIPKKYHTFSFSLVWILGFPSKTQLWQGQKSYSPVCIITLFTCNSRELCCHSELNSLEKWANRSLIKFNRENAKSCIWGGITPCTCRVGGWLVRKQLCNMSLQQRLLTAPSAALGMLWWQVEESDPSLLSTAHTTSRHWVLLWPPPHKRDEPTVANPEQDN